MRNAIYNENEAKEVTSIYINYAPLLLRKTCDEFPEGRTSYRFKNYLRSKVTIIDKNGKIYYPKENNKINNDNKEDKKDDKLEEDKNNREK